VAVVYRLVAYIAAAICMPVAYIAAVEYIVVAAGA
jgi:hypothetical protein